MVRRALIAALLAVILSGVANGVASAHSEMISTSPDVGEVVTTPLPEVALTFNQEINENFANVTVTDDAGRNWAGTPQVEGATVRAPLEPALPSASYTISYRVVSADGHPISGSHRFTYAGQTVNPSGTPTATPAPSATHADGNVSPATMSWVFVAALAAVVIGGLAVILLVVRRSKR